MTKRARGCRVMARRTFLILVGVAIARFFAVNAEARRWVWGQLLQTTESWGFLDPIRPWLPPTASPEPVPTPVGASPSSPPPPEPSAPGVEPAAAPAVPLDDPVAAPSLPPLTLSADPPRPVQVQQRQLQGVTFYQSTIDLRDPANLITIGLANNAPEANRAGASNGDEPFPALVARAQAALVANGTFFSKDDEKRVMGNMVAAGQTLKFSPWENYGTTLGIRPGNRLEMVTARAEGRPAWEDHWFSLTCGPRLVKQGEIWLAPASEGFQDPHVLTAGVRCAIGYPPDRTQLWLVTFMASLTLRKEAEIMQALGCFDAMNLDGGASQALAHRGQILVPAGRPLTNVIVVYDANHPAPEALRASWSQN